MSLVSAAWSWEKSQLLLPIDFFVGTENSSNNALQYFWKKLSEECSSHFWMPKGIWQHCAKNIFFSSFPSLPLFAIIIERSQVKWALSSWIDAAAAYNHTNMCVSMEEYQAHFTFSLLSPCNYIATCISRSRRQQSSVEEQNSLELLLCTLQNSPHTHLQKCGLLLMQQEWWRDSLPRSCFVKQSWRRQQQHFFFISSIQWGSCQKCLLNARIHAVKWTAIATSSSIAITSFRSSFLDHNLTKDE